MLGEGNQTEMFSVRAVGHIEKSSCPELAARLAFLSAREEIQRHARFGSQAELVRHLNKQWHSVLAVVGGVGVEGGGSTDESSSKCLRMLA